MTSTLQYVDVQTKYFCGLFWYFPLYNIYYFEIRQ